MSRALTILLVALSSVLLPFPAAAQSSEEASIAAPARPDRELRFGAWVMGGTFAGRFEWQGTVIAGGGLEVAFGNNVRLRVEGLGGWESSAGAFGTAVPAADVARLGLRLGVGIAASHLFELRTFGGLGMWLGEAGDGIQASGNWEMGQRLVFHFPPDDHLEVGAELTWHGPFSGATNPFGGGVFVGFVL